MDTNVKCPMCGGQFRSQQEVDEHVKQAHSNHTGEEQQEHAITCTKCGMKAKSSDELNQHEQQHTM